MSRWQIRKAPADDSDWSGRWQVWNRDFALLMAVFYSHEECIDWLNSMAEGQS